MVKLQLFSSMAGQGRVLIYAGLIADTRAPSCVDYDGVCTMVSTRTVFLTAWSFTNCGLTDSLQMFFAALFCRCALSAAAVFPLWPLNVTELVIAGAHLVAPLGNDSALFDDAREFAGARSNYGRRALGGWRGMRGFAYCYAWLWVRPRVLRFANMR